MVGDGGVCGYKQVATDDAAAEVGLLVLTAPWPVLQYASTVFNLGQPWAVGFSGLCCAHYKPRPQLTTLSSLHSTAVSVRKIGKSYVRN